MDRITTAAPWFQIQGGQNGAPTGYGTFVVEFLPDEVESTPDGYFPFYFHTTGAGGAEELREKIIALPYVSLTEGSAAGTINNIPVALVQNDGNWDETIWSFSPNGDPFMGGVTDILGTIRAFYAMQELRSIRDLLETDQVRASNTNLKLDSANELLSGVRGAIVDVKNQPEDACIIRIYVGDQTKKREAAAREIERLLGEGYRPYQTFGISEDLARVLFVKYPEPNDANVAP